MVRGPALEYHFDIEMDRKFVRSAQVPQENKLFVGGLSWNTTDEHLKDYFSQYGTVQEAYVALERSTSKPRGFGFVVFCFPEDAFNVRNQAHYIDGRKVEVKEAIPKEAMGAVRTAPTEQRKLFIGGLAPATQTQDLISHFEQYGIVEDAVVMQDHNTKRPRGFGFVTFSTSNAALKAFEAAQKVMIKDKVVEVKFAVPRDDMPLPNGLNASDVPTRSVRGRSAAYAGEQLSGLWGNPSADLLNSYFNQARPVPDFLRQTVVPDFVNQMAVSEHFAHNPLFPPLDMSVLQGGLAGGFQALDPVLEQEPPFKALQSQGLSAGLTALFAPQAISWAFTG